MIYPSCETFDGCRAYALLVACKFLTILFSAWQSTCHKKVKIHFSPICFDFIFFRFVFLFLLFPPFIFAICVVVAHFSLSQIRLDSRRHRARRNATVLRAGDEISLDIEFITRRFGINVYQNRDERKMKSLIFCSFVLCPISFIVWLPMKKKRIGRNFLNKATDVDIRLKL